MFTVLSCSCEMYSQNWPDQKMVLYSPAWTKTIEHGAWMEVMCWPEWDSDHELVVYRGMGQPT